MAVEAVDAGVELAADEPLRVRRLPVEHPVPRAATIRARRRSRPRTLPDRVRPRRRCDRRVTLRRAPRRRAMVERCGLLEGDRRIRRRFVGHVIVGSDNVHPRPDPECVTATERLGRIALNAQCGPESVPPDVHASDSLGAGRAGDVRACRWPGRRGPAAESASGRSASRAGRRGSRTPTPATRTRTEAEDQPDGRFRLAVCQQLAQLRAACCPSFRAIRSMNARSHRRHQDADRNRQDQVDERTDDAGQQADERAVAWRDRLRLGSAGADMPPSRRRRRPTGSSRR